MVTPRDAFAPTLPADMPLEYLNQASLEAMFHFPRDMERREVEPNRLTTAVLATYYRNGWKRFN